MATVWMEAGSSATYGLEFYTSTSGSVSSSSTQTHSNNRSILCDSAAGNAAAYVQKDDILFDTGRSVSVYCYFNNLPTTNVVILSAQTAGGASCVQLRADTNGTFTLLMGSSGSINGGTYSTGSWIRLCLSYTITNAATNEARVYKNGAQILALSNQAGTTLDSYRLSLGWTTAPGASKLLYLSDIYVSSVSSVEDTADIFITPKLPVALNTNNFDTLGGSGTNRYDRVSERPVNVSNYIQHAATSYVEESFGIQSASQGDVNISGYTYVAQQGWCYAKAGADTSYTNQSKTTGTTLAVTVSNPQQNNFYLIAFAMDGASGTVSCTDNASTPNTYAVDDDIAPGSPGSGNVRVVIFRAKLTAVTNLTTVTITHPSVAARAAVIKELGQISTIANPLETGGGTASANSNAFASCGSPSTNNAIVFSVAGVEQPATDTFTAGSLFSGSGKTGTTGGGGATNISTMGAWGLYPYRNPITGTFTNTIGSAVDWSAAIQTYQSASATGCAIVFNGVQTSVVLSTTNALYLSAIVDTSVYPANAAGIGMKSNGTIDDTYLYECGVLVAYIPVAPGAGHPARRRFGGVRHARDYGAKSAYVF